MPQMMSGVCTDSKRQIGIVTGIDQTPRVRLFKGQIGLEFAAKFPHFPSASSNAPAVVEDICQRHVSGLLLAMSFLYAAGFL